MDCFIFSFKARLENFFFFFFSSRRRHTRSLCDWSSDVCSSDLDPGGRGAGGVCVMALMQTTTQAIRHELVGLGGVVERNWYLVKRYIWWELAFFLWTAANTLTIVFIAEGVGLSAEAENELATKLLIGAVIWSYLGIVFEILTETVAWERWEGTIEYTFM